MSEPLILTEAHAERVIQYLVHFTGQKDMLFCRTIGERNAKLLLSRRHTLRYFAAANCLHSAAFNKSYTHIPMVRQAFVLTCSKR